MFNKKMSNRDPCEDYHENKVKAEKKEKSDTSKAKREAKKAALLRFGGSEKGRRAIALSDASKEQIKKIKTKLGSDLRALGLNDDELSLFGKFPKNESVSNIVLEPVIVNGEAVRISTPRNVPPSPVVGRRQSITSINTEAIIPSPVPVQPSVPSPAPAIRRQSITSINTAAVIPEVAPHPPPPPASIPSPARPAIIPIPSPSQPATIPIPPPQHPAPLKAGTLRAGEYNIPRNNIQPAPRSGIPKYLPSINTLNIDTSNAANTAPSRPITKYTGPPINIKSSFPTHRPANQ